MAEFIVTKMPYDTLVEEVQANTQTIAEFKKGASGNGLSLENTTPSDRLVVVKPNSSDAAFLENTLGFEGVPVVKRDTGEVDLWLISNGYGGRVVARTAEGYKENGKDIAAGNICLVPETSIPNEGNFAASVEKVNTLIANSGINVGSYLVKKPDDNTESTMTIPIRPKGQYIVRGGTTTIDGFQGDCEFHMLVFFASGSDYIPNKVFHLFQKEQNIVVGSIPSIGSELIDFTGDSITIRSTDTQYGSWIITEN